MHGIALNQLRERTDNTAGGGNNYTGGKWYMTVDGQQFPTIPIRAPDGEIWRVALAPAA